MGNEIESLLEEQISSSSDMSGACVAHSVSVEEDKFFFPGGKASGA